MKRLRYLLIVIFGLVLVAVSGAYAQDDGDDEAPPIEEEATSEDTAENTEEEPLLAFSGENEYMGERVCSDCHRDVSRQHENTPHALALQEPEEEVEEGEANPMLADFSQGEDLRTVTFPDGTERAFVAEDIAYIIGAGRYVQAYVYDHDGQFLVFPPKWNTVNNEWVATRQGEGWADNPAYDFGSSCASCHVTDFQLEDGLAEWGEEGVQCEACHGMGGYHVEAADEFGRRPSEAEGAFIRAQVYTGADPQTCGQCHARGTDPETGLPFADDYHVGGELLAEGSFELIAPDDDAHWWLTGHGKSPNMQFNEWFTSAHAEALEAVKSSDAGSDECLVCHSSDYRYTESIIAAFAADEERLGIPPDPITLDTAQYGVTCITCHDPHALSSDPAEAEENMPANFFLRNENAYELCVQCHTDPDITDGAHAPVQQMFEGLTVLEQVEGIPSDHFSAEDGPDCVSCHLARVPVDSFSLASHSLNIVSPSEAGDIAELDDSCTNCHGEVDAASMGQLITDIQSGTDARVEAIRAQLTGEEDEWVMQALNFVEADPSRGVHNYTYADALLKAVEATLAEGEE